MCVCVCVCDWTFQHKGHAPEWSHLVDGFYAFKASDVLSKVCFVASIGHIVYACRLCPTDIANQFNFIFKPNLQTEVKPIGVLFDECGLSFDQHSYRLFTYIDGVVSDRVALRMRGAELVKRLAHTSGGATSSSDAKSSKADIDRLFELWLEKVDLFGSRGSDCDSLWSGIDSSESAPTQMRKTNQASRAMILRRLRFREKQQGHLQCGTMGTLLPQTTPSTQT